jgi:hypothetical protein
MRGQAAVQPLLYRGQAPALSSNAGRNLLANRERSEGWKPARDALWRLIEPLVGGVGSMSSGTTSPLGRLTP